MVRFFSLLGHRNVYHKLNSICAAGLYHSKFSFIRFNELHRVVTMINTVLKVKCEVRHTFTKENKPCVSSYDRNPGLGLLSGISFLIKTKKPKSREIKS